MKTKTFFIVLFQLLIILMIASVTRAQNNQPYLGQTPPGMSAQRFPPDSLLGNNNWWWHGSPVFTPDGLEMFWTEYVRYSPSHEEATLFTMKVENDNWGPIHYPEFGNVDYMENNPVFSTGGDTLYFSSLRPGGPYFWVTKTATGWSQPVSIYIPLPSGTSSGMNFSVNKNGDFFLELYSTITQDDNLYIARYQNGHYKMATKMGDEINSGSFDGFPYVDPDENYLIFASNRPGGYGGYFDMYISYKNTDDTWAPAINMGYEINSAGAWYASVTLDKQYLFFNTAKAGYDYGYNPYWISAAVIDSLQLLVGMREQSTAFNQVKLYPNKPNPFSGRTNICFEISNPQKLTLDIYNLSGVKLRTIIDGVFYPSGIHAVPIDTTDLPPGIYTYLVKPERGNPSTGKMIVIK